VYCVSRDIVLTSTFTSLTQDYKKDEDPAIYRSEKTGRGPLQGAWKVRLSRKHFVRMCCAPMPARTATCDRLPFQDSVKPVMCCYKLVRAEFKWWGLQGKVEKFILKVSFHDV